MESKTFDTLVTRRCRLIEGILKTKSGEYARADQLHNFKKAGLMSDVTPEFALQGMLMKHLVSIFDMVADLDYKVMHPQAQWEEKLGDAINYLILLEALVTERAMTK